MMMPPEQVEAIAAEMRRHYRIDVHRDLSRWTLRPWWATMTQGIFHLGDVHGGVWRARTREQLIAKCERVARRNAARAGIDARDIVVTVAGATPATVIEETRGGFRVTGAPPSPTEPPPAPVDAASSARPPGGTRRGSHESEGGESDG